MAGSYVRRPLNQCPSIRYFTALPRCRLQNPAQSKNVKGCADGNSATIAKELKLKDVHSSGEPAYNPGSKVTDSLDLINTSAAAVAIYNQPDHTSILVKFILILGDRLQTCLLWSEQLRRMAGDGRF